MSEKHRLELPDNNLRGRHEPAIYANMPAAIKPKLAFVDALRGYAVLLVITCHTGGAMLQLPTPLKRVTNFGWHGVQLFFLISCFTLLLSWESDVARGKTSVCRFWFRRFFRIAPMYYFAILFYLVIDPPNVNFSVTQLLATLTFVNAWHPALLPTLPGRWTVVPGGWSVGVEFTFYLVFPGLAKKVRSLVASAILCALALVSGSFLDLFARSRLFSEYDPASLDHFVYFWFPNQMSVFAIGTALYFFVKDMWDRPQSTATRIFSKYGGLIVTACAFACIAVANIPFPYTLPFQAPLFVPTLYVASMIFFVCVLSLSVGHTKLYINPVVCWIGQVSFSAYLIHFAVLKLLPEALPSVFNLEAENWQAIYVFLLLEIATVAVTTILATATFQIIEQPMINLGRRILSRI